MGNPLPPAKKLSNNWLRRASTIYVSHIKLGHSQETSISNAMAERTKDMSKQFDRLFTNDSILRIIGGGQKHHAKGGSIGHVSESDEDEEEQLSEYEASYWSFEADEFNFEHMKFSIVSNEHVR